MTRMPQQTPALSIATSTSPGLRPPTKPWWNSSETAYKTQGDQVDAPYEREQEKPERREFGKVSGLSHKVRDTAKEERLPGRVESIVIGADDGEHEHCDPVAQRAGLLAGLRGEAKNHDHDCQHGDERKQHDMFVKKAAHIPSPPATTRIAAARQLVNCG